MQVLAPYQRRVIYGLMIILLAGLLLKLLDRQKQATSFDISGFMDGYRHSRSVTYDSIDVSLETNAAMIQDSSDIANDTNAPYIIRIDINSASNSELQALPGIGPVLAESIIEYRQTNGPLTSAEELLKVKGIGRQKLQEIEKYISFEKAGN